MRENGRNFIPCLGYLSGCWTSVSWIPALLLPDPSRLRLRPTPPASNPFRTKITVTSLDR